MGNKMIRLSLSVTTDDPEVLTRATETFSRTAAGLSMDGVECFMMWSEGDDDDAP